MFYFNNPSKTNIERGKALLKSYGIKDSVEIAWIASKLNKKESKSKFYHTMGDRFYDVDDYDNARYYYMRSLALSKLLLQKDLIADDLSAIGDMYRLQDQNTIAAGYLFQAMYLYKELGNQERLSHILGLIGDLNRCMDQYKDALRYLNESLEIALKHNYKKEQTFCYSSLGGTHHAMEKYDQAHLYYDKGVRLALAEKDSMRLGDFLYSIGDLYIDEKKLPEAIKTLNDGILVCKAVNDQYNLAYCYMGLARAYLHQKKYNQAIEEANKTYKLGEKLNAFGFCSEASEVLFEAYEGMNDHKNAFKYLKIVKDNYDSTMSTSQIKEQAQIEMQFRNSYKEKQDSLLRASQQKQKDIEYESELQQQRILAIAGIAGLLVAVVVVAIVFRSYKKEKRSRQIINTQKAIVDTKNKEILDSINYAKKIQQAIIPTHSELKNVFPESFVLLLPKDIVSGDFYWVVKTGQQAFFAVADCTGHGVPGGFMSMLGTALLNEIINEKKIYEPADILDLLKLKIILALRQSENTNENKDGMDISLLRIDMNTMELSFAGANNSLYHLRDNKLTELKGDKFPVGFTSHHNKQFSQQKLQLKKNDLLYMFSDGYPDQFGGLKGKKFKYKQLEDLLVKISSSTMEEQRKGLVLTLETWKGELEQVDDICVAGISI